MDIQICIPLYIYSIEDSRVVKSPHNSFIICFVILHVLTASVVFFSTWFISFFLIGVPLVD